MIVVAGTMRVDPARRDHFLEVVRPVVESTRAEPGNVQYRYCLDSEDPTIFLIFEEWQSEEAFQAHFATAHMQTFLAALPTLGITDGDVHRYDVASKTPWPDAVAR
jgi:quinol monooxygenase YgiN